MNKDDFEPIVLGGDAIGYSYAREFNRVYGKQTTMIATADIKYSSRSRYTDYHIIPNVDQEDVLVNFLKDKAKCVPLGDSKRFVLGGASDWHVRTLSKHKEELEGLGYVIPYIDFPLLDRITQKDRFYAICKSNGAPIPKTIVVLSDVDDTHTLDGSGEYTPVNDDNDNFLDDPQCLAVMRESRVPYDKLMYPVILKPANSAKWHYVDVADKHKVYKVRSENELRRIIHEIFNTSCDCPMLVQEMLSDSDESLRTVTTFTDADGNVDVGVCADVLVQDRSSTGIGNPLVIMGWDNHADLISMSESITKACKYEGYANFDVMLGRDGKPRFLEVNTRPGRNSYYVSMAGCSFVKPIVEHYIRHNDLTVALDGFERSASRRFLFTMVPRSVVSKEVHGRSLTRALSFFDGGTWENPLIDKRDCLQQRAWARINFEHMRSKFK